MAYSIVTSWNGEEKKIADVYDEKWAQDFCNDVYKKMVSAVPGMLDLDTFGIRVEKNAVEENTKRYAFVIRRAS